MPAPGWTHAVPNGRTGPRGSTVDTAATPGPLWTTTVRAHHHPPARRSDRDVRRRIVTQAGFRHKFSHLDHRHASGKAHPTKGCRKAKLQRHVPKAPTAQPRRRLTADTQDPNGSFTPLKGGQHHTATNIGGPGVCLRRGCGVSTPTGHKRESPVRVFREQGSPRDLVGDTGIEPVTSSV
jgi:hypothetical protein